MAQSKRTPILISQVLQVTSWLSREGGGIPPVVWSLARESRALGTECFVLGLVDEFAERDCGEQGIPHFTARIIGPRAFGFSPELRRALRSRGRPGGVIHSHGLWMYPGMAARVAARNSNSPLVISPHGMIEPWALANSGWKKAIAACVFEHRNLRSADCLHALCNAEADSIRNFGVRKPVAVIPNGINPDEFTSMPAYEAIEADFPVLRNRRRALFLSRLHPKKGLEHLLNAWRSLRSEFADWHLVVAGSGERVYEEELGSLAKELGLADSVLFVGSVRGSLKRRVLAGADLFVLPSFSEGFSMAILEAAAAGLPVLLTKQCNFSELARAGGAMETRPDQEACQEDLRRLMSMTPTDRRLMGARGRALIYRDYTWSKVASSMLGVYRWVLGSGDRPDFVVAS